MLVINIFIRKLEKIGTREPIPGISKSWPKRIRICHTVVIVPNAIMNKILLCTISSHEGEYMSWVLDCKILLNYFKWSTESYVQTMLLNCPHHFHLLKALQRNVFQIYCIFAIQKPQNLKTYSKIDVGFNFCFLYYACHQRKLMW